MRRGYGRAYGAVSIVNAISTGRGAALGVDLTTEAYVELDTAEGVVLESEEAMDSTLVAEVVKHVGDKLGLRVRGCRVRTMSSIPMAVGLKSSSSAAVATTLALLDAFEMELSYEETLTLVTEASKSSGTSITGALDDAAACMLGGIVVTDNYAGRILKRDKPPQLDVVIAVPTYRTYTRDFRRELLTPIRELVEEAFQLALKSEYWKAMTLNGILHAAALSLKTEPIIEAIRAGAVAAGVSGTGPAVAAVANGSVAGRVGEVFIRMGYRVISCRVNMENAVKGGGL
ncbi:MAG: shikimate kinase [Nitrososphaerota archaeon]